MTGTLSLIVNHLLRFAASGSDAEPVPETLRRLLLSVLPPVLARHGAEPLAQAAAILGEARDVACEEIFAGDGRALADRPRGSVARRRGARRRAQ